MKPSYKLLLATLLLPALTFAQSNFKPGYAVTLKGDTLKGDVDYREWGTNPRSVTLKTTDGVKHELTPQDVSYFEITGLDAYKQYTGKISTDESRFNRIQNGRDTSFVTGSYFLRILQQGNVINIYAYVDELKPRYFYNTPADPAIHELVYRVYHDTSPQQRSDKGTFYENGYVQQLSGVALNAGVMDDKLQQMMGDGEYTQPAILKITSRMNGLTKAPANSRQISVDKARNLDLYAGVGASRITTKPEGSFRKAGAADYSSLMPKAVFGFNAYVNPNIRQLVFGAELGLSLGRYRTTYTNKVYPYIGLQYGFNQFIISLTPQVAYNFYNSEKFKLFAGVGFDVSKYSYSNTYYRDLDGKDVNYGAALFNFHSYVNSLMLKVGTLINGKFQIYANYVQGGYITNVSYENIKQNTYQAGVNYFFTR